MAKKELTIYTVSQVTSLIKAALEEAMPAKMVVAGEISDWKIHYSSGHCYFSLKDENAVLPCVMWASDFKDVKFRPENGLAVLAKGFIDVYPPQGKYQLYVERLEPAGVGALQLAFEQMRKRLEAEGLFDEKHKRPLPKYPMRIGILTSESGAALYDIKDSIHNRWPCARLFLYPVPVQGEGAAEEIAAALRYVNRHNNKLKLDVLIVGRGGGSLEDLWAFNEEVLARAIFASKIPVISAVGHEVDITIADLVADARASTPTKAGVIAVPDIKEVLKQIANYQNRLSANLKSVLQLYRKNLETILASRVFKQEQLIVLNRQQWVDELTMKMKVSVRQYFAAAKEILRKNLELIVRIEPHRLLGKKAVELNEVKNRSAKAVTAIVHKLTVKLTAQANRLSALNPKSVLNRGYSITKNKKTGLLVRKADDVEIGDIMITELAEQNLIESKTIKK
jgi:exodeoxyribonuclease VII large subunit